MTSNLDSWREVAAVILGILMTGGLPFLISLVKQETWSAKVKSLVALLLCIATGALTVLVSGNFSLENLAQTILAIYTASNLIYNQFLKDTPLDARLEEKSFGGTSQSA